MSLKPGVLNIASAVSTFGVALISHDWVFQIVAITAASVNVGIGLNTILKGNKSESIS